MIRITSSLIASSDAYITSPNQLILMNLNLARKSRWTYAITTIIALLLSCKSKKQEQSVTWLYGYGQAEKLNGRVKKLIDERFGYTTAYNFDYKGNLLQIEHMFKNGTDTTKCNTIYSGNDKKTESNLSYTESARKFRNVYRYDNDEHLTRCFGYVNDTLVNSTRFSYDKADNLIKEQLYTPKELWNEYRYRKLYNKNSVCTGLEQLTVTRRDNFKSFSIDTVLYTSLDAHKNWLKAKEISWTFSRKITYY